MSGREQLNGLTAARGIAAWMVVLYHMRASMPWLPAPLFAFIDKGYLAVDFFFLLSGFVITLSAAPAFAERGLSALPAFLMRRAARIYPLYALMLALTVLFALMLEVTGRNSDGYPWRELPLHVAMLQNWGFTDALSWNHPAWSISTEFAAYLLFPLLVLAIPLKRAPGWALAAGVVAAIAAMAALLHAMGYTSLGEDIPHSGLIRCLCEFTAGCLLCALWQKSAKGNRAEFAMCLFAIGAAGATWTITGSAELWAFPAIAAAIIYLLARASLRRGTTGNRTARALIYLGEISYATYISHFMLFIWFKIALVDDASDMAPGLAALFLLLTLAVSILLHHAVEKPGRTLFRPGGRRALTVRAT